MAQRAIPRPFNPFIAFNNTAMIPTGGAEQLAPIPRPNPLAVAPRIGQPPMAMGASAAPALPQMAMQQPPSGGGLMGGVQDFLGSDASLALAAGLLGGGSTNEAVSRGFQNAFMARQKEAPATTDDLREYAFAKQQGYDGSFVDFVTTMKKAGATTVDARQMGNIPPGYQVDYDEQGRPVSMSPIPGSPDAVKADDAAAASAANQEQQARQGDIVTQDIDRAISLIDSAPGSTTGVGGAVLQSVPGTTARDVKGLIDTVKANVGFDKLQAMRDASPTGGALGQVSEKENALLQATIGNLEQSQSTDQLRDNLNRVWNVYQDIIHGPGNGPPRRPIGYRTDLKKKYGLE